MKIQRSSIVIILILILFLIPAIILHSQSVDTRDIKIVSEKPVLDGRDLQIIDDFLAKAIEELVKTKDFTSIARTRTVILSNQSSQGQYAKQFSQSAYKYISAGFQQAQELPEDRRFKVNLNLLILIDGLKDPRLADLAIARLKDNNKVIRYWAVRCITNSDLIKKISSADAANAQLLQRIMAELRQIIDSNPPMADEILALITEFAAQVNFPEAEDLSRQIAEVRIKQYADWTVQYELLDGAILKLLSNKIALPGSSKPEIARRFAQLYSYVFQKYLNGQDLKSNNKQYLASVLVETEDKCLGKLLGRSQSNIRRAIEQGNNSLLAQEYDRLFGDQAKAGELTMKLNVDYGTGSNGKKRLAPLALPDPPKTTPQ